MDGLTFYETFKEGLRFIGLDFHKMHLAKITANAEGDFVMSYEQYSIVIRLPK